MDTNKLLKAIQILVREEIKEQLPSIIKETVKSELKKMLAEQVQKPKKEVSNLSMSKAILGEEAPKKPIKEETFTKNPMLNQILNETRAAMASGDDGFRTINFTQSDMGSIVGRTALAEKMGYGDFTRGPQASGLGVQTGNDALDKALNRDYSELVKRFKK